LVGLRVRPLNSLSTERAAAVSDELVRECRLEDSARLVAAGDGEIRHTPDDQHGEDSGDHSACA